MVGTKTVICGRCDEQAQPDTYKGESCLSCPGCNRILARGLD